MFYLPVVCLECHSVGYADLLFVFSFVMHFYLNDDFSEVIGYFNGEWRDGNSNWWTGIHLQSDQCWGLWTCLLVVSGNVNLRENRCPKRWGEIMNYKFERHIYNSIVCAGRHCSHRYQSDQEQRRSGWYYCYNQRRWACLQGKEEWKALAVGEMQI